MRLMNETAISVEGLAKRFGEVVALDGVDFEVSGGSVFGLLGPNGAGKTTAVRILSTILAPDGGRAEVLGRDVVRDPDGVRRRIGLAGQYAAVDPNLTGRENLRMTGRLAQLDNRLANARGDELLERFDLAGAADRPVRTYSGGMPRRLDVRAAGTGRGGHRPARGGWVAVLDRRAPHAGRRGPHACHARGAGAQPRRRLSGHHGPSRQRRRRSRQRGRGFPRPVGSQAREPSL